MRQTEEQRLRRCAESRRYRANASPEQKERRLQINREWRQRNPERCAVYNKAHSAPWRDAHPEYMKTYSRGYHRLKKYGITPEEWDELFAAQGFACAACGSPTPGGQFWHTDHKGPLPCRRSDIRGILCRPCNHAAGKGSIADILRLRDLVSFLEETL